MKSYWIICSDNLISHDRHKITLINVTLIKMIAGKATT